MTQAQIEKELADLKQQREIALANFHRLDAVVNYLTAKLKALEIPVEQPKDEASA